MGNKFEKSRKAKPEAKQERVAQKLMPEKVSHLCTKYAEYGLSFKGEYFEISNHPGEGDTTYIHPLSKIGGDTIENHLRRKSR